MKRRQGQYIGGFPIYGYRKDPALHATIIPGTGTRLHLPGSGTFGHVPAGSPSSRPREAKGAGLPCTVIFRRS